jgi:DNA-directed RNA polymerase subunit K/omega
MFEEEEERKEEEEEDDEQSEYSIDDYSSDINDDEVVKKIFDNNGDIDDKLEEDLEEPDFGDEEYFKKIDSSTQNYICSFHPQLKAPSDSVVQKLSIVKRNENGIIDDPLHRTEPFLKKYERTHIIGVRASQLESGAEPLITVDEYMSDVDIATAELNQKVLPFIIWRPFPNGSGEFWKLVDLEIL